MCVGVRACVGGGGRGEVVRVCMCAYTCLNVFLLFCIQLPINICTYTSNVRAVKISTVSCRHHIFLFTNAKITSIFIFMTGVRVM